MNVGDLVEPVSPAIHKDGEFLPVLVVNKRRRSRISEVEVLHPDGEVEWFPEWMMKKASNR